MSVFNEIVIDGDSPMRIQFKYGMRWNYSYQIGDKILWDHLKRPLAAAGLMVVPGICRLDPKRMEYKYFAIHIVDDVITAAQEISELEFDRLEAKQIDRIGSD